MVDWHLFTSEDETHTLLYRIRIGVRLFYRSWYIIYEDIVVHMGVHIGPLSRTD